MPEASAGGGRTGSSTGRAKQEEQERRITIEERIKPDSFFTIIPSVWSNKFEIYLSSINLPIRNVK
jgi:hypothetical protein